MQFLHETTQVFVTVRILSYLQQQELEQCGLEQLVQCFKMTDNN